jgi:hypothetical protein
MKKATTIATAAAILLGAGMTAPAGAKSSAVIGLLECNVSGGVGLIVYSSKELSCTFRPNSGGKAEHYRGRIEKFGVDVGATAGGYFGWAVWSQTSGKKRGALVGNYGGLTAEATVIGGVGANALVGGNSDTVTLQPISVQAQAGLNLAAGVAALTLSRP